MNKLVVMFGKVQVVVDVFAGSKDHRIPNVLKVMDPTSGRHQWMVQDATMEFPDGVPQVAPFEDEEDEELRISSVEEFWDEVVQSAKDLTYEVGMGRREDWTDGMVDRFVDIHQGLTHLLPIEECGPEVADHLFSRMNVQVEFN